MLRSLAFGIDFRGDSSPIHEMNDAVSSVSDSAISSADSMGEMETATDDLNREMDNSSRDIEISWNKIALAISGAGVALEGFARKNQEANATLGRAAHMTGETEEELRNLAVSMSDYTFSARDATEGMELLIARGYDTTEQFEAILPVVDELADATGKEFAGALVTSEKLMSSMGLSMEDLADNTDYMTRLMIQTDIPLATLERNLGRVPDELQAMELGLAEASAGIEVFQDRGYTGQESVREFRRAVEESDGDMESFLDVLGITNQEWLEYQDAIEPAAGLTQEIADINNSTMTTMQKMSAELDNLMFKYSGLAEVAGMLAPIMVGLGPVIAGLAKVKGVLAGVAGKGLVVALKAKAVALGAVLGPIALVVGAIAGIIFTVRRLYQTNEDFRELVQNVWGQITDVFQSGTQLIRNALDFVSRAWENHGDKVMAVVRPLMDFLTNIVTTAFTIIFEVISGVLSIVQGVITAFSGVVTGNWSMFLDGMQMIWQGAWNMIKNIILLPIQLIRDTISGLLSWIWEVFTNFSLLETGKNILTSLGNGFLALVTFPLDAIMSVTDSIFEFFSEFNLFDIGANIIGSLASGIASMAKAPIEAVENVASGITGRVKGIFGINSPSREFMEVGESNMEGLKIGMEQNEPDILDYNSSPNPITSGCTTNNNHTFNPTINIQVDGSKSPEDTARKIKMEFDKLMKQYTQKMAYRNPSITEF